MSSFYGILHTGKETAEEIKTVFDIDDASLATPECLGKYFVYREERPGFLTGFNILDPQMFDRNYKFVDDFFYSDQNLPVPSFYEFRIVFVVY